VRGYFKGSKLYTDAVNPVVGPNKAYRSAYSLKSPNFNAWV